MPSSLLSLASLAVLATQAVATQVNYNLQYRFDQTNFFQNFSFYSDDDPTHGYVKYLGYDAAKQAGLAKIDESGNVYLGVDSTNKFPTGGRPATRVQSNIQFDQGLLIADITHMPGNACGVWPAFWTTGSNWPLDGEIDIIEGINQQSNTQLALHTQETCNINSALTQTGNQLRTECSTNAGAGGCTVMGTSGSYGDAFNALGGGVYAMEVTSKAIKVWFFPRSSIPECITAGHPDPAAFGTPMALFEGGCDFEKSFVNQQIIINTDFCGDWAGYSFGSSSCASSADKADSQTAKASCEAYVGANPLAFAEAYWKIASIELYQQGPAAIATSAATSAATAAKTSPTPDAPTTAQRTVPVTTAPASVSTSSTPASSALPTTSPVRSTPSAGPSSQAVVPNPGSNTSGSNSQAVIPTSGASAATNPGNQSSGAPNAGPTVLGGSSNPVVATTSCSSKKTVTVTSTGVPSSSGIRRPRPTNSSCSSKSTVTVTSTTNPVTSPAVSVAAVSTATSKLTTTTVIVTSYVDVCPTGFTTKTITQTVTYCPGDVTATSIAPVMTTTSKLCTTGCAPTPTTVVVVIPVETSTIPAQPTGGAVVPGTGATGTSPAGTNPAGTNPAQVAGPSPGSGSNPSLGASAVGTTVPVVAVPGPLSSQGTTSTLINPASPIYATGGLVSVAPPAATKPVLAQPSGAAPGGGSSSTSTGVSPAFTGAGIRIAPSTVSFLAVLAGLVLLL